MDSWYDTSPLFRSLNPRQTYETAVAATINRTTRTKLSRILALLQTGHVLARRRKLRVERQRYEGNDD